MRRSIVAMALAGALVAGWGVPATAQQNGIVIQNNGVSSTDSAAGADNVRVSRAPGNSSSTSGAGLNNEVGTVVRQKERNRKDRKERRNAVDDVAAPVEEAAPAPADGDYQVYTDEATWVEPTSDAVSAETTDMSVAPIKLPNTGAGRGSSALMGAVLAAAAAVGLGATGFGRRFTR